MAPFSRSLEPPQFPGLFNLLPRLDLPDQEIRVSNKNSADFECFRFDDLNFFYGMSERERLQRRV